MMMQPMPLEADEDDFEDVEIQEELDVFNEVKLGLEDDDQDDESGEEEAEDEGGESEEDMLGESDGEDEPSEEPTN